MQRFVVVTALVMIGWLAFGSAPDIVLAASKLESATVAQAQTERSAQTRKQRPNTRIRVYRAPAAYPGRYAVRQCVDWYAEERRPSGTVVVPHMRCRWVVRR